MNDMSVQTVVTDEARGQDFEPDDLSRARFSLPAFEKYWNLVVEKRWTVLAIIAFALLLGLVVTLLATPQYTASSVIEISRETQDLTDVQNNNSNQNDQVRDAEFYETQYSLLEARSLAARVDRVLGLSSRKDFLDAFGINANEGQIGTTAGPVNNAGARTQRLRDVIDALLDHVAIVPVRGSSLVEVRFTSPNPRLSAQIANAWVEQYVQSTIDRRFASTSDARKFLEVRLAELRQKLEDSERELVTYGTNADILNLSQQRSDNGETVNQQTLAGADLQAMNEQLAEARAARIQAASALNQGKDGLRDALTNPTISALRERRGEIAAERAKMLATFEPDYPAVQELTAQLQNLDNTISRETGRIKQAQVADYNQAAQREASLQQQVNALKDRMANQNRASIQYNIYQRDVDTNRELYNALLQRYKEIGAAGVGLNNIAAVDKAEVPDQPSSPKLALNLALALLLGLFVAAAYVFLREQLDQSLRDPADVTKHLGLPQLGVVPDIGRDDLLEQLRDRKSIASEAYSSIAATVSFLTSHGIPRSILFTSTQPNEGKSTSAVALSQMLLRMGKRVALIDADMRNPSIHKIFGIPNEAGLSNYLAGDERLDQLINYSTGSDLGILPVGPIPPDPLELLSGDRFGQLLQRLADGFDHFIVDGPPVLGLADAPLLGAEVEGVIFTIEANGAKMRAVSLALGRLRAVKAHIFGAIVTKVDERNSSYGYGSLYGYGYSYGGESRSAV
jgi:capsular exopolysaccharide synthesis family protein